MPKYKDISVQVKNDNEADVYLNLPSFRFPKLLGTLYRDSRTFRTINRTSENLLFKFRKGRPQIGVNVEILTKLNFKYLEIPFNNTVLRTTREHFIKNSIPSPFKSEKLDFQRALPIDLFIVPDDFIDNPEPTLFELEEACNGRC